MSDMKKKAKDILEDYSNFYSQVDLETLAKFLEQIKSEAYREFAELLKATKFTHKNLGELVYVEDIDNTLDELTGGSKNE